jgi:hypothetical protein
MLQVLCNFEMIISLNCNMLKYTNKCAPAHVTGLFTGLE